MIKSDEQLAVTRQQIERVQNILLEMRKRVSAKEYQEMSPAFLGDITRMEAEIHEYLSRVSEPVG